jgi:hypothetical protein
MTEFELDRAARFEALENAVTEFLNSDGPFFILAPREEEEDDDERYDDDDYYYYYEDEDDDDDTESDPWDKVASA